MMMEALNEKTLLGILAEQDEGEGVPFSTAPAVSMKGATGPRAMMLDKQVSAMLARLRAGGLVEQRAVVGEDVFFALTPRGQQKADKRRGTSRRAIEEPEVASIEPGGGFLTRSVVVPAVVAALTVLILRVVGL